MARISDKFRLRLDKNLPLRPVRGEGYVVEVHSRDAVRYLEHGKTITMFSDLVRPDVGASRGGLLSRWLSRITGGLCLGVYVEEPLRWDNENTDIAPEHAAMIVNRVKAALEQRTHCYQIERGPNQQGSGPA